MSNERDPEFESILAVYLIDLRSEYESELRELTKLQRYLEDFRRASREEERRQLFVLMTGAIESLRTANKSVSHALADAFGQISQLAPARPSDLS